MIYEDLARRQIRADREAAPKRFSIQIAKHMKPALSVVVLTTLSACTTQPYQASSGATTVRALVSETWNLPNFDFAKKVVSSTYQMRISTYSSPQFIHAQQMQPLAGNAAELDLVCKREGGTWTFLAPAPRGLRPVLPSGKSEALRSAAGQIGARPLGGEDQMRAEIATLERAGELDSANQGFAALLAAQRSKPDSLTESALAHAERLKWFGVFGCQKPALPWTATITPVSWRSVADKNYQYREVTVNTVFSGIQ